MIFFFNYASNLMTRFEVFTAGNTRVGTLIVATIYLQLIQNSTAFGRLSICLYRWTYLNNTKWRDIRLNS